MFLQWKQVCGSLSKAQQSADPPSRKNLWVWFGRTWEEREGENNLPSPQHIVQEDTIYVSAAHPSFPLLLPRFLSSLLDMLCVFCCCPSGNNDHEASSASAAEFFTHGSAQSGLQHRSAVDGGNSARPAGYLSLLDCVCVSYVCLLAEHLDRMSTILSL